MQHFTARVHPFAAFMQRFATEQPARFAEQVLFNNNGGRRGIRKKEVRGTNQAIQPPANAWSLRLDHSPQLSFPDRTLISRARARPPPNTLLSPRLRTKPWSAGQHNPHAVDMYMPIRSADCGRGHCWGAPPYHCSLCVYTYAQVHCWGAPPHRCSLWMYRYALEILHTETLNRVKNHTCMLRSHSVPWAVTVSPRAASGVALLDPLPFPPDVAAACSSWVRNCEHHTACECTGVIGNRLSQC